MNPGVTQGLISPATQTFYFDLLTASNGSPTQPVGIGRFAGGGQRNMIRYYDDGQKIYFQMHVSWSQITSAGSGDAYVVKLPYPAKRLTPGQKDYHALGEGIAYFALVNPAPNIKVIATLADPWTSLGGDEDNYMQFYIPYNLSYNDSTVIGTASSRTVNHVLGYTPSAADINVVMGLYPSGATRKASTIKPLIDSVGSTSFTVTPQYPNYRTNIVGNVSTGITTTANRYIPPTNVVAAFGTSATGAGSYCVVPGNAKTYTFDNFQVEIDTASGSGVTRTFTVQKNGSDTALTLTISGTSQVVNSDTTHSFTAVSGDQIGIRTSADLTTASTGTVRWTMRATSTTNTNISTMSGGSAAASTSATQYLPLQGFFNPTTTTDVEQVMPNDGTFQNCQIQLNGTPGAGKSYALTLYKNGSPTSITATVADTNTTASDTTHTVTYVQGDRFYWQCVPSGTPSARPINISLETVPTTPGESVHLATTSAAWLNSAVRYDAVSQPASAGHSTTESPRQVISQAAVWKKMYAYSATATGAAKTWNIQLVKEGSAGNPQVTIDNSATTKADNSNTVTTALGDTISLSFTPSGTPASTLGEVGVVSYIVPDLTSAQLGSGNDWPFRWQIRGYAQDVPSQLISPTTPWAWGSFKNIYLSGSYEKR